MTKTKNGNKTLPCCLTLLALNLLVKNLIVKPLKLSLRTIYLKMVIETNKNIAGSNK